RAIADNQIDFAALATPATSRNCKSPALIILCDAVFGGKSRLKCHCATVMPDPGSGHISSNSIFIRCHYL
ncbi:MAG: hypothetical protein P8N14_09135, partial [Sulfitobacter sp.]|nr:hypothetical protein [Sulfitobacter sp.]